MQLFALSLAFVIIESNKSITDNVSMSYEYKK